jgi:NCS1 family nucleobase:cation symporter-1
MVAGGLLWWHALLATIVGHLFGATMTIINGRGGSVYHVGFPIWMRATFGMWGGILPVLIRTVLDMVWFGIQTYFGGLFLDLVFQCIFG